MLLDLNELPDNYKLVYNELKLKSGLNDIQFFKMMLKIYQSLINGYFIENPERRLPSKLPATNCNET